MDFLLDTHTLIWVLDDTITSYKIPTEIIKDPQKTKYVSIASLWEVTVKLSVNRLSLNFSLDDLLETIKSKNYTLLPIKEAHLEEYLKLPFHHRDPFDRLLIATAIFEKFTLITSDKENQLYDVKWVW